jgi:AraC-like DNA-binding protein
MRKFKGLLDTTPNEYIRIKRLNIAATMLRQRNCRISDVCYTVGFYTPSYFTKCFKRQFGMQPNEYMKEYAGKE